MTEKELFDSLIKTDVVSFMNIKISNTKSLAITRKMSSKVR